MELVRRKRVQANNTPKNIIGDSGEPCHDLQLYIIPPTCCIALAEMYDLAVDRMKVLRILEQTLPRVPSKNLDDKVSGVLHELKKQGLKTYAKLLVSSGCDQKDVDHKARMEDHISHFIVRLSHCQSESLRRWFTNRELELFRLRFHSLSSQGVKNFLNAYQLNYSPISAEEKRSVMNGLLMSTSSLSYAAVETTDFYKVHYTEVLDLVATRRVYLSVGNAYTPNKDLLSVVSTVFMNNLEEGLQAIESSMAFLEEDERLRPLTNLHKVDFGETYNRTKEVGVTVPEDLDPLSKVSFPPCMRQLHESIRKTHHAKHGSRMQYGLFLKRIGLSLEDAVRFWREEFTKNMPPDKFQSHYLYNIRHNYGQEGKRTAYSAYSCMKIISGSVGPGDCHGCPFKHNSSQFLKQQLDNYGIPPLGVQAIMDFVSQQQYQLACTKYFEITHPDSTVEVIYHPNQFFELSRKFLTGEEVPSRKNFETNRKYQPTKMETACSSTTNSSSNSKANDSGLWENMDVDVSLILQEAEQKEEEQKMLVCQ